MPLFGKPKRFVEEAVFRANLKRQVEMAPTTLNQLRQLGVSEDRALKLEYFFYTNTDENAAGLATTLAQRGYSSEHGPATHDRKQQVITGWTTPIRTDRETVIAWVEQMCRDGFEHDCEFDGWGTTPEQ